MRSHSKALFTVAALFAFLLLPASAFASKGVVETFGGGGNGAGQFAFPLGVALNQGSGDVYVVDGDCCSFETGGQRISQFSAAGEFIRAWGWGVATGAEAFEVCTATCQRAIRGSGPGQFSLELDSGSPQLAIDQSDGSVYVVDNGNDRVQKFSASGVLLDEFGSEGAGDGQFNLPFGIAVDPVSGDVYVADSGNNRIQRFDSSGNYLSQIGSVGGGSGEGEFFNPQHLAVDSTGRLYVIDLGNERVQRFSAAGAFDGYFAQGTVSSPTDVAVDPANDHVFLVSGSQIVELDAAEQVVDTHRLPGNSIGGLSVRSSTGLIYASEEFGAKSILVLDTVLPPTVAIEPVTDVAATSATFNGTVDPEGPPNANYSFEYSTDGVTWTKVPQDEVPLGTGSAPIAVSQTATGLEPNTEYRVRLASRKDFNAGEATSSELTFKTTAAAPDVRPIDPGLVMATKTWLGAEVNPRNADTSYYIEYSTDPGFASSTSIPASENAPAGAGGDFVFATREVSGLQPSTTYHYRVVATNVAGTTTGPSRSFATLASSPPSQGLPDGRVYEKVSPAEKQGANIDNANVSWGADAIERRAQAASSGDAVTFASAGKFGGDSGPAFSQYLARRGPNGWSTEGINPLHGPVAGGRNANNFRWFAEDLSWGIVISSAGLNPGDADGTGTRNLYFRDNETRSYRTISNAGPTSPETLFIFRDASEDGATVTFTASVKNPSTGGFDFQGLFERGPDGLVRQVGVLQDETNVVAEIGNGDGPNQTHGFNPISADGSRIYFTHFEGAQRLGLYLRENGTSTILVSASERFGDDETVPRQAQFIGASKDGSIAYFTSWASLTDESALESECEACQRLYRWERNAPAGERLTDLTSADPRASTLGATGMSDDGRSFYFVAEADLAGAGDNEAKLYLWRQNEGVRLVTRAGDQPLWDNDLGSVGFPGFRQARITPDGRFLVFMSKVRLTAYDNAGTNQLYRYDSASERLDCVSCGTVFDHSKGGSWLLSSQNDFANGTLSTGNERLTKNLSSDGRRVVFDSKDALVPEDSNGAIDVYEWQDGRLHLLSTGTSSGPSRLIDASTDGDDVFFVTGQRLTRSDTDDLVDLYDARVGGVPEPNVTPPCIGDECQGTPAPPPPFPSPSSSTYSGAGNVSERHAKPRCAKGKARRKGRCVAKKQKRHQSKQSKRANTNRRNAR